MIKKAGKSSEKRGRRGLKQAIDGFGEHFFSLIMRRKRNKVKNKEREM
jgi:hypothetical protein